MQNRVGMVNSDSQNGGRLMMFHVQCPIARKLSFKFPDVEEYLRASVPFSKDSNACSNNEVFSQLLEVLGIPPLFTVVRVNVLRVSLDKALQQLQQILREASKRGSTQFIAEKHSCLFDILLIHGFGPDSYPLPVEKEVIVDTQCGAAVLRGADVFAPGVMGAHPGIEKGDEVSVYADLDGKCHRGLVKPFDGRKVFVGNGNAVLARNDIFCFHQNVSGVAVCMTSPLYRCPSLSGVLPHLLFLQNLPSVVVGHVVDPQPNEVVLDMCASPGGKTTHLALLMEDKGKVVAFDKSEPKVAKLTANCHRLGITCVYSFVYDSIKALDPEKQYNKKSCVLPSAPPYPCGSFDRVLVDAPCSALGQRPQFVVRMTLKELQSYPSLQRKLLNAAVGLLKEGGVLVYSTCTVTPQENEQQVAWALESFPCLRLDKQTPHLGGPGFPNCGLSEDERLLVQRFDPTRIKVKDGTQRHDSNADTIGFFIAKFVKTRCANTAQ